jgi:hypothetical protein
MLNSLAWHFLKLHLLTNKRILIIKFDYFKSSFHFDRIISLHIDLVLRSSVDIERLGIQYSR